MICLVSQAVRIYDPDGLAVFVLRPMIGITLVLTLN